MNQSESFRDKVLRIFESQTNIRCRPYGHVYGLYYGECFFGIIAETSLYFRVGSLSKQWYRARRLQVFHPTLFEEKPFYQVPERIIAKPHILIRLAREAIGACKEHMPESPMPQSIDG